MKIRFMYRCLVLFLYLTASFNDATGQVYFLRDTFCSNQILIVNNHIYGPDNPEGTEILPGAATNGADSIIEVRLVFYQPAVILLDQVICGDDTLWINNVPYHAGFTIGQEVIEGGAENGCDSIIQIQLTAGKVPVVEISDTLCPGEFMVINGTRYDQSNPAGTEVFSGVTPLGCDSVVNINLTIPDHSLFLGDDATIAVGDTICIDPQLNFQPVALEWSSTLPCLQLDCFPLCQPFFTNFNLVLSATDSSGCVLTDAIFITVNEVPPVYAPTVFNPDASWPNNRFFLSAISGITRFKSFQIASRWGELIWQKENVLPDNPGEGWDGQWKGKIAQPGVYVYWIEAEWGDGTTEVLSGSFTLLR